MKKAIIVTIACLLSANVWATTTPDSEVMLNERVNATAGGIQSSGSFTLLGSLGETIIGSMSNDVNTIICGFLQAISVFEEGDIKAKLPSDRIAWAVNNKFNPTKGEGTIIQFRVDKPERVTIKIYNLFGEFIKTVVDRDYDPIYSNTGNDLDNFWSVTWAGSNINNAVVGSGIYLIVVKVGGQQKILKAAVIK
jgi:hypothetical protein